MPSGGIFEFEKKSERLDEVNRELENPRIWSNQDKAQALGKERSVLNKVVSTIKQLDAGLADVKELLELAREEQDAGIAQSIVKDLDKLEGKLSELEFQRMFSKEMDQVVAPPQALIFLKD